MGNSNQKSKYDPTTSPLWQGDKEEGSMDSKTTAAASKLPALEDIPEEFQAKIRKCGISAQSCEENLAVMLSILHFLYKRKFKLRRIPTSQPTGKADTENSNNEVSFDVTVNPEVLDGPEDTSEKEGLPLGHSPTSHSPNNQFNLNPQKDQSTQTLATGNAIGSPKNTSPQNFSSSTPSHPNVNPLTSSDPPLVQQSKPVENPAPKEIDPNSSDYITPEDLAREARSITEGDPYPLFSKFSAHGQGFVSSYSQSIGNSSGSLRILATVDPDVDLSDFGFGRVEKAKHIKSKTVMAIKRMPHASVKQRKANMQEVHFLRLLKGKGNIVNYFATFRKGEELWVIMEFMEGGTLGQAASKRIMNEHHIAYIAREILKGLNTIHLMKLAHRDLKPHNIMIDIDGAVKLIDFGLCVDLKMNKEPKSMLGSAYWMAPEMIRRETHGTAVDIWAFGIIMYEVLLGKPINSIYTPLQAMFINATQGGPPISEVKASNLAHVTGKSDNDSVSIFGNLISAPKQTWSDSAYDFVQRCLEPNPSKRPTARELLRHPFLESADDQREMRRILKVLFLTDSLHSAP